MEQANAANQETQMTVDDLIMLIGEKEANLRRAMKYIATLEKALQELRANPAPLVA